MQNNRNLTEPEKDDEIKTSDKMISLSNWRRVLGWFMLVMGIIVTIANGGNDDTSGYPVVIGLSLVIASRLVRGFGLLVEKSVMIQRSNEQIVNLMVVMLQRDNRQTGYQAQPAEPDRPDDSAKYPAE